MYGRLAVMDTDYPEQLLAREPAPPYDGEGPFALWHYSEDPALSRFLPRAPTGSPEAPALVWAVDAAERVVVGDLLGRHADAGIELRITPSIWPFWRRVASSTV